jgi:hypothetical protein
MIDTFSGSLQFNHSNIQLIKPLLDQLQREHKDFEKSTKAYSGSIENLRVNVNEFGVRVEGSLSKFLQGNNVTSLTPASTKLAVEKLCDVTHLPMYEAQIHRLDFAENLSMDKPAAAYYGFLGERKNMQRLEQGYGLYYQNTLRQSVFYDKTKELIKSKAEVEPEILLQHLLRFEVRLYGHKNICKYFNVPEMKVEKLCEPSFYRGMVGAWATEYDRIDKYKDAPLFDDEVYRKPTQFCAQIMYKGIEAMGGYNKVMSLVKQAKSRGVFKTVQQYIALRRKVRCLNNIPDRSVNNILLDEMNTKVLDVLRLSA